MNSLFRIIQDNPTKSLNPFVINSNNKLQMDITKTTIEKSSFNNLESNIKISNIESNNNNKKISDIKYWEYGNSGLKIKDFNKIMSKNLSILSGIHKQFNGSAPGYLALNSAT